jgi:hypothetical protein
MNDHAAWDHFYRLEYELWLEGKCRCGIVENRCKCRGFDFDYIRETNWL